MFKIIEEVQAFKKLVHDINETSSKIVENVKSNGVILEKIKTKT